MKNVNELKKLIGNDLMVNSTSYFDKDSLVEIRRAVLKDAKLGQGEYIFTTRSNGYFSLGCIDSRGENGVFFDKQDISKFIKNTINEKLEKLNVTISKNKDDIKIGSKLLALNCFDHVGGVEISIATCSSSTMQIPYEFSGISNIYKFRTKSSFLLYENLYTINELQRLIDNVCVKCREYTSSYAYADSSSKEKVSEDVDNQYKSSFNDLCKSFLNYSLKAENGEMSYKEALELFTENAANKMPNLIFHTSVTWKSIKKYIPQKYLAKLESMNKLKREVIINKICYSNIKDGISAGLMTEQDVVFSTAVENLDLDCYFLDD